VKNLLKLGRLSLLFITSHICLFLYSTCTYAKFEQIELNDENYILLDVQLSNLLLLQSVEMYQQDDQILVPLLTILSALELEMQINLASSEVSVVLENETFNLKLIEQESNLPSFTLRDYIWAKDDIELYVGLSLLEKLLAINIDLDLAKLKLGITSKQNDFYFPIEKRLTRKGEYKKTESKSQKTETLGFYADQVILDQYHFITPPTGQVALNLSQSNEGDLNNSLSLQLNSDLLYHSAYLNLNKTNDESLAGFLQFSRSKSSPYEALPLGIANYSWGDISSQADNFEFNSSSGIGFNFSNREANYSRKFGTTFLEGFGVPGWEVELYADGYFIDQKKIDDRGIYRFDNIETKYGINKFQIKLFGPHGEEETRIETVTIDGTRLRAGESQFDGAVIESGKSLLSGGLEDGFSPTSYHYGYDIGLTDTFQLGVTTTQRKSLLIGDNRQFIGVKLQSSLSNLLLNTEVSKELSGGMLASFSGLGQINTQHQYAFNFEHLDDFNISEVGSEKKRTQFDINLTGSTSFIGRLGYSLRGGYTKSLDEEVNKNFSARLSGRAYGLSISNEFTYLPDLNTKNELKLFGNFRLSGSIGDTRLSSNLKYYLLDNMNVSNVFMSISKRFENELNLSGQINYAPNKNIGSKWSLAANTSWALDNMVLKSTAELDDNDNWNIKLGIAFALGYDHINNRFNMSRKGVFGGGTLDLNAFLDRNANGMLDVGDYALEGAEFGPFSDWSEQKTGSSGKVVLQGVPTGIPIGFVGAWNGDVTPMVPSYNLFTHPGGYIKADIPFTIKTDISGYAVIDNQGEEAVVSNMDVELINHAGLVIFTTKTDFDGYYEFNQIMPGSYQIKINNKFMENRNLKSNPETYLLKTPQRGGYIEIGTFSLFPNSSEVAITQVEKVLLTDDNYDPAFLESDYEGNIFVKVSGDEKDTFKPLTQKVTTLKQGKLKVARLLNNELKKNTLELPENIEQLNLSSEIMPVTTRSITDDSRLSKLDLNFKSEKNWHLQFAAFSQSDNAELFLNENKVLIPHGYISLNKEDGIYKVLSGDYSSKEIANLQKTKYLALNNGLKPIVNKSNVDMKSIKPINRYTIQIAAMKDTTLIAGLVKNLSHNSLFIGKSKNNITTLVLVGSFQSRHEANKAISKLPSSLNKNAWVRLVSEVNNWQEFSDFNMSNKL